MLALQLAVERGFDRGGGKVRAGVGRVLHFAEYEFGVDLPRDHGNFQVPELEVTHLGFHGHGLGELLGRLELLGRRGAGPFVRRAVEDAELPGEPIDVVVDRNEQLAGADVEGRERERLRPGERLFAELADEPAVALGLLERAILQIFSGFILDRQPDRGHEPADGTGEVRDWALLRLAELLHRVVHEVRGDLGVLAFEHLGMAVPLHEYAERRVRFRIVKADGDDLVVLDDRLAGIADQVRIAGGSDLRDGGLAR